MKKEIYFKDFYIMNSYREPPILPDANLIKTIKKLGQSDCPVLITGETGTGKEVIARSIHAQNPGTPFVIIDCSTLVGPLMESELFGHVKGAFTGASTNKAGLIATANGGTAFFDEIGELPLELQSKLLRLLQDKSYRRVGTSTNMLSTFRFIAATNRDLEQGVKNGTIRQDLYYRLNVVNLKLQPLRDRREDIPALVEHFLKQYGQGRYFFSERSIQLLYNSNYDWPGNVRELESAIQGAIALGEPEVPMEPELLPEVIRAGTITANFNHPANNVLVMPAVQQENPAILPTLNLRELEKMAIKEALTKTNGDTAQSANLLGMGRTTLYRRIKELGLEKEEIPLKQRFDNPPKPRALVAAAGTSASTEVQQPNMA